MYRVSTGETFRLINRMVEAHINGRLDLTSEVELDTIEVETREVYVTLTYDGWSIEIPVHELTPEYNWSSHSVYARDFSCKNGVLKYESFQTIEMDLNVDMWGDHVDFSPPEWVDIKYPESIEVDDSMVWAPCSFERFNESLRVMGIDYYSLPDFEEQEDD